MDNGNVWRATLTPEGPGSLQIKAALSDSPEFIGYGPGGDWLARNAPELLGATDVIPFVAPQHKSVKEAQRRFGQLRLGRSLSPYHELLPAILGQRVTAVEALRQWREIVRDYGTLAPGPMKSLLLPPAPQVLAEIPYFTLHAYGVEKKRADTLAEVGRQGDRLIRFDFSAMHPSEATASLSHIRGVGVWTAAVAGGLAFGDPDALQVGDFHVKNTASWALNGIARGTDEEMVQSMAPYAGQRHRVMRWLELAGWRAPARGARQRIVSITHL